MDQEKLKEIGLLMLKRLDLVCTGALLLLLGVAGAMILSEKNSIPPAPEEPPKKEFVKKFTITPDQPIENLNHAEVRQMLVDLNTDMEANPLARRIIANNMFVMKTAQEQAAAQEESNRQYNQAERLVQEGKPEEALKIVEAILLTDPSNRNAQQLKARLTAPAPTATPEAPAP